MISNATGEYTVTGLNPFTEYQFYVVVCTSVGCGTSEIVSATTFENGKLQYLDMLIFTMHNNTLLSLS